MIKVKNGKIKLMSLSVMSLSGESPSRVDLRGTVFGYSEEELRSRLSSDSSFRTEFMLHYEKLSSLVKDTKDSEKKTRDSARALARAEKEEAERSRLTAIIKKIQENDPEVPDGFGVEAGDPKFFEESSIKYLKEWVKNYKKDLKTKKEAEKKAKLEARAVKEAEKEAKKSAKLDKQAGQMVKMEADLVKWNDVLDMEVLSFVDKMSSVEGHFKEMKAYHTRIKLLVQLGKFAENVEGVPEWDEENISDEDLKAMHTRVKLLNQLTKFDTHLDYECDKTIEEIKETIAKLKQGDTP